ncbi:MAG TPA: hypothetical protein VEK74_03215 [Burkholderiaceae bacterium]|nr:hypothetical protein [Burkholderiaceae bacterium]
MAIDARRFRAQALRVFLGTLARWADALRHTGRVQTAAAGFVALTFCGCANGAFAAQSTLPVDRYPGAAAAYGVVVDGQLAWARAIDAPRPPASLAKLLTAIVLLDGNWDSQAQIVVSKSAAEMPAVRLGLRAGDALGAGDALLAMLVRSANDACAALVEHAAGSFADFARRMNERAQKLGMSASHFVDPCGLDAPGQYTTVRDLLRLAQAAYEHPQIASAVARRNASIETAAGRHLYFENGNLLLSRMDGVIGMKSGFTSAAGRCLIALARRGTHQVWLVMLDAPQRWSVAMGILFEAFDLAAQSQATTQ